MSPFEQACKEKFERGRREHGQPWDAQHVDARREMQQELCDLANYSDLLNNRTLAQLMKRIAEMQWRALEALPD